MSDAVARALEAFVEAYVARARRDLGGLPRVAHDPAWPSPCLCGAPGADGTIAWRPVRREAPADFSGLAAALETGIDPDWQRFYAQYWSEHLDATGRWGRLQLLQLWNAEDEERLVANQIGHALQRRRLRRPLSLFVACGDDPDLVYSVDNATGRVQKESLARGDDRVIAASLAEFLDDLEPFPAN